MHIFYTPDISAGHLPEEESRHAIKVLRLTEGSEIRITDGKGSFIAATVKDPDSRKCRFKILTITKVPKRRFSVHLAIAPTKNSDRMEWLVEKCVEIGIERISFLKCQTSERKSVNLERFEKIAVSAMKQSQQAWLPTISEMVSFSRFIKEDNEGLKFIAYVDELNPNQLKNLTKPSTPITILIGPEGDFTSEELSIAQSAGYQKVSLGPTRLRTETAGLVAVTTLNQINIL